MKTNLEIEFKTKIDSKKYAEMINLFQLKGNIFSQTNFYFDDELLSLNKIETVLRIRQKGSNYKLTLKERGEKGALEQHFFIDEETANEMQTNGFNTLDYFKIDKFVTFKEKLTTNRARTPYLNGVLFFDESIYLDKIDYEIEYEVEEYDEGLKAFNDFLLKHKITPNKTSRKSARALSKIKQDLNI